MTTMDAELEFAIQPSTTGKQLFDQVDRSTHIHTHCCLSMLCFTDTSMYLEDILMKCTPVRLL